MNNEKKEIIQKNAARLFGLYLQARRVRDLDLSGVSLIASKLDGLIGDNICLVAADLSQATLHKAQLVHCDLSEAILSETKLMEVTLRMCTLNHVRAFSVLCENARIEDCSVQAADFSKSNLRNAKITESSWVRSSLFGAILENIEGYGVVFRGADLREVSLSRAKLVDADFRGADLTGADISCGDFRGADFRGAILDNVNWTNALLTGARFDSERVGIDINVRDTTQGTTPEPEHLEETITMMKNASNPHAFSAALAQLVSNAVSTSAQGNLKIKQELKKVSAEWENWCSKVGNANLSDLSMLLESIEQAFGKTNLVPQGNIKSLVRLLDTIKETNGEEPPEELKALLKNLFPEIIKAKDGKALDALASSLATILERKKNYYS